MVVFIRLSVLLGIAAYYLPPTTLMAQGHNSPTPPPGYGRPPIATAPADLFNFSGPTSGPPPSAYDHSTGPHINFNRMGPPTFGPMQEPSPGYSPAPGHPVGTQFVPRSFPQSRSPYYEPANMQSGRPSEIPTVRYPAVRPSRGVVTAPPAQVAQQEFERQKQKIESSNQQPETSQPVIQPAIAAPPAGPTFNSAGSPLPVQSPSQLQPMKLPLHLLPTSDGPYSELKNGGQRPVVSAPPASTAPSLTPPLNVTGNSAAFGQPNFGSPPSTPAIHAEWQSPSGNVWHPPLQPSAGLNAFQQPVPPHSDLLAPGFPREPQTFVNPVTCSTHPQHIAGDGGYVDSAFCDSELGCISPCDENCWDCPWRWHLLPDGLLYRSYLAGPKESRLGTSFLHEDGGSGVWDVTLGAHVGLIRFGTPGSLFPDGWQLDFDGSIQSRMDLNHDMELTSHDYRIGLPITWAEGPWHAKLGLYRTRSQFGDDFLFRNPGVPRRNYLRDSLVLGVGHYLHQDVRIYAEADYAFNTSDGANAWHFQFGLDYSPVDCDPVRGAPFFAINGLLREEVDFGGSLNVMTGWQWRGARSHHLLRVGLRYFNGKSAQYAFSRNHEELLGGGIWYDF